MSKDFKDNLVKLYKMIDNNQKEVNRFFGLLDGSYQNDDAERYVYEFLDECELEHSKENMLALLTRLINLRDEQLVQTLYKENRSEEEIERIKLLAYLWTKNFHIKRFEGFIDEIEKKKLLNSFYTELIRGVHLVGKALSEWQFEWSRYIINELNKELKNRYKDGVIEYLKENALLECDKDGNVADRSYSTLKKDGEGYILLSYSQFFKEQVSRVSTELERLILRLRKSDDPDTDQKDSYIKYFETLLLAFRESDRYKLLNRWRDVDRAWMDITSPLQVGHPLEYYEDHYRKSVALEWDLRVSNPNSLGANDTLNSIKKLHQNIFNKIGDNQEDIFKRVVENLTRIQLYIGRPALFYASEFNGLFSAQVVPNDEIVTKERGKKIFAFADNVLESLRAKPPLKIHRIIFGDEFVDKDREFILEKEEIWHKIYEISTIGHEYGHILWLDEDSEVLINQSGMFKNIEEFKATCGGLCAYFFEDTNKEIREYLFRDIIKRAINLIAWMKTPEVEPYYCEGLIHLSGLFESGVLKFNDEKLYISLDEQEYNRLKEWYMEVYEDLAKHYLDKKDAKEFLYRFVCHKRGVFMPKDKKVSSFVDYYWKLYQDIGREIDF